jgi:hypothetical protein
MVLSFIENGQNFVCFQKWLGRPRQSRTAIGVGITDARQQYCDIDVEVSDGRAILLATMTRKGTFSKMTARTGLFSGL